MIVNFERRRRRLAIAAVAVAGVVAPALVARAEPRGSDPVAVAESLCPRVTTVPPDDDCYTIPLPAEAWGVAAILPPAGEAGLALYEQLLPDPYGMPDEPQVGVFVSRLNVGGGGSAFEDDPGPGYQEGSIALRATLPDGHNTPWDEGWFVVAQPINDTGQYGSGRDVGIPKYLAEMSIRNEDGQRMRQDARGWTFGDPARPGFTPDPAAGGTLVLDWAAAPAEGDGEAVSGLVQLDSPLLGHERPYDEQGDVHEPALTKFTPAAYVPAGEAGAVTPLTAGPDVRLGLTQVTLTGPIPTSAATWRDLTGADVHEVLGAAAYVSGFVHMTFDDLDHDGGGQDPGDQDPGDERPGKRRGPPESRGPKKREPLPLPGCAPATGGGEWRSYGNALDGRRHQADEDVIDADGVRSLEPAWTFEAASEGSGGLFHATPIVADGCVYLGTNDGWAFALNADSGETVWKHHLRPEAEGLLGTGFVGSPAIVDRKVIFLLSQAGDGDRVGPVAIALSQESGAPVWGPVAIDTLPGAYADASVVAWGGVVLLGFNGDETRPDARGGYAILDASTGELLVHRYVVPDDEHASGSGGGSIWATAAVDGDGYAYVGTSNPVGRVEHELTNAIVKIDLDRSRPTFGDIVAAKKGTPDEVVQGSPTCGVAPNGGALSLHAFTCFRNDVGFGASPNLFEVGGRPAVGELQKSGVYHVAFTDTMETAWEARVGHPTFYGNISTSATDGERIYVAGSPPGQLVALGLDGSPQWVAPLADLLHFPAVTVANGVVYTVDATGFLLAFDATSGLPIARRQLSADNGGNRSAEVSANSASLSIARHRLFVAAGGFIVSYRPGPSAT